MANTIKLKRGSGSDPQASDLEVGELAIRTDSGKIFTKKDNGSVAEISGGGGIDDGDKGDITVSNGGDTFTIDSGVVTEAKIAGGAVTSSKIAADSVNTAKIADSAVTEAQLATDAVTTAKIDGGAVTSAKIAASSINTAKIADSAVTSAKIADGTIVNADISGSAAIAGTKISPTFTSNFTATGTEHKFTSGTSGDCKLIIEADSDNNNEADNPLIALRQDGGIDVSAIGHNFSGSSSSGNELFISNSVSNGGIVFYTGATNGYTNGTERLRIASGGQITGTGNLTLTSTAANSSAAPIFELYRNSASPADADYLGQLKFTGESDDGSKETYAKITGKIDDASSGTEDGILEFMLHKAGSNNIAARFTSTDLKLINGTGLEVAGETDLSELLTVTRTSSSGSDPILKALHSNLSQGIALGYNTISAIGSNTNVDLNFEAKGSGHINMKDNLDCEAGLDVIGNIGVSGTVDGVDIATRDTLFGGLTSSSGVLKNGVTATTQSAGDNSTKVATTAYTDTAISNLVDSAPGTLNTLNELAAALGDDANFSTTVTNSIATKLPLAGGTLTGSLDFGNNVRARFGNSQQLQILFDGNNPLLAYGTGTLFATGSTFRVVNNGVSENIIWAKADAEVELYYNNSMKFETTNTGVYVNGNVAVTGTVDGRDVATDGTKLDGIESNATADQTASEILTLLKTVDGAGSGLDADTLDGVQVSGLVAVGGDTMTGNLRVDISSNVDGILGQAFNNYFGLRHADQTQNSEYMILSNNSHTFISATSGNQVRIRYGGNDSTNELQVGSGNDALTWRGNKIFHAGNDGAGSGLDADTLDGVSSASFLRSDANDTSSGTIAFGFGVLDPDSFASFSGGFGKIQDGGGWAARGVFVHGGGTGDAAAMAHNGSKLYFGIQDGSSANSMATWLDVTPASRIINFQTDDNANNVQIGGNKIFHAGNDGSGSGLDADLLDGVQGSSYLRSDADDSTTGLLTLARSSDEHLILQGSLYPYIRFREGTTNKAYIQWHADGFFRLVNQEDSSQLRIQDDIKFSQDGSTFHSIFHEGNLTVGDGGLTQNNFTNTLKSKLDGIESGATADQSASEILTLIKTVDGPGSGLDADLFDGEASDTFLYRGTDITNQDFNTFIDGTEASWNTVLNHSGSNRPSGAYTYGTALSFSKSSQAKFQLYAPETASSDNATANSLWFRTGWNTTYRQWARILDSNDVGSGNGLDADKLDGQHGSYYRDAGNINAGTISDARLPNSISSSITGNAATATKLATARTIAGVSFDGSANISLNNNAITNGAGYITSADGGNAATLDSLDSTQFARSDANDTISGNYSFSSIGSDVINFTGAAGSDNRGIAFNGRAALTADQNDGYLRLNNESSFSNGVYTPLVMRADGGFFVDGTSKGINGSGNFIGGTIAGASDYSTLLRSNAADTASGDITFSGGAGAVTIAANSDIRLTSGNWTGNAYGKIQHHSNRLYISGGSNSNPSLIFRYDSADRIYMKSNGTLYPATDSASDLGVSNYRWANGYFDTLYGDGSNLTGISAGATGGGSDQIFYENGQNVTSNYTITNGKNAMSAGPITINSGVTVTVGSGETWTVV